MAELVIKRALGEFAGMDVYLDLPSQNMTKLFQWLLSIEDVKSREKRQTETDDSTEWMQIEDLKERLGFFFCS